MLIGLVQSLKNVQAISGERAARLVADIKSDAWYPMPIFFGILDEIQEFEIDLDPILFQAGAAFIQDWFTQFDGHTVFPTAKDFILAQAQSGGYAQVHRGNPDEIGWLDLLDLNESEGRATVVCVTPYPKEFERGLFFSGVRMAGDVDYAHVDSVEEPYNHFLSKKTVTIHYHRKPNAAISDSLDAFLANMSPSAPPLPARASARRHRVAAKGGPRGARERPAIL